jgi:hypothetical protein
MAKALYLLIVFFLIFRPSPADAGPDGQGPWYAGPKVTKLVADRPLDTAWNAGVLLGRIQWGQASMCCQQIELSGFVANELSAFA